MALSLVVLIGLMKSALGLLLLATDLQHIAVVNAAGIPRWMPRVVSLLLACAAVCTWRNRIDAGLLAAWWALAAGAFARPAPLPAHGEIWTEVLLMPICFALLLIAATPSTPSRVRLAVLAALGTPIAVGLCLALHELGVPSRGVAAATYTSILAAAALSVRFAAQLRRPA